MESNNEGKAIAEEMKIKYWEGIPFQEIIGNPATLKNKSGISQRFYFFEGQAGISVDEAYRFLQNRWLEKQMLVKRKQTDNSEINTSESDGQTSSGNGLLKKKRFGRSKNIKPNKSFSVK